MMDHNEQNSELEAAYREAAITSDEAWENTTADGLHDEVW
jgi:hypothetical protein